MGVNPFPQRISLRSFLIAFNFGGSWDWIQTILNKNQRIVSKGIVSSYLALTTLKSFTPVAK